MSQSDISESDIDEDIEYPLDPRKTDKKSTRILDRHIQYLRDIFSLELYMEGLTIIPAPTT